MSGHASPVHRRPARGRTWPCAALLAAASAALLCAACLTLPQAAHAEAAPGSFAWQSPWLFGTTEASFVVDLVKAPADSVYAAGSTGYSQTTSAAFVARLRKSDGSQIWRKTRAGIYLAGAASDTDRNVVLAGNKGGDIVVVKYRPNGSLAWARRWGGATTVEIATDVAGAGDGAVYVSGMRNTGATGRDAVVVCFAPGGALRWRHLTATKSDDIAETLTVGEAGNVYVTGSREGGPSDSVWTTYKLTPAGRRLWVRNVTFVSSNTFGEGCWIRVRGDSLYVVAQRGTAVSRFAAMKLSLAGEERWVKGSYVLPGPTHFSDAAVDAKGRLYVVGWLEPAGTPGVTAQGELLVVRANGTMAWHDELEDPLGAFNTSFGGVAVDADQRAYCGGYMATAANNTDMAAVVVRYEAGAGIEKIWRWDGGVGEQNGFGPLLRDVAIFAGAQVTTAGGQKAMVQRLKP